MTWGGPYQYTPSGGRKAASWLHAVFPGPVLYCGSVGAALGRLLAALGDLDAAAKQLERAAKSEAAIGAVRATARTRQALERLGQR